MPINTKKNPKKVALIHDYLREYGGAERVLEALKELFPDAPVYTAFMDQDALGRHWSHFQNWDIRTTWLAKVPLIKKLYSPLRVLAARAFHDLDLSDFDLVISSSNAYMAKAAHTPHGIHVCYCHTPPRALYGYTTMSDWRKNPLIRVAGTLINHYMRVVDVQVAQAVDYFIANSEETRRRIQKFYRRDSVVINPPVIVPDQPPVAKAGDYYMYVNRLALAKHPELAVQAANQLGLPLKVVGSGNMEQQLKAMAGPTIEFLGAVTDDVLSEIYRGAKALLYPVEDEDFGIVPVEAMAYGVPVVAHHSGGPMETIVANKTGVFFDQLTVSGLIDGIQRLEKIHWDRRAIYRHAQQYSQDKFIERIEKYVGSVAGGRAAN